MVRSSGLESCQDDGLIGIKRKQNSNMTSVHIFENIFFLFWKFGSLPSSKRVLVVVSVGE